jgi:hypothetical protein
VRANTCKKWWFRYICEDRSEWIGRFGERCGRWRALGLRHGEELLVEAVKVCIHPRATVTVTLPARSSTILENCLFATGREGICGRTSAGFFGELDVGGVSTGEGWGDRSTVLGKNRDAMSTRWPAIEVMVGYKDGGVAGEEVSLQEMRWLLQDGYILKERARICQSANFGRRKKHDVDKHTGAAFLKFPHAPSKPLGHCIRPTKVPDPCICEATLTPT